MNRRRILYGAVILVVLCTMSLLLVREPTEPVYEGKRLSEWIEQYADNAHIEPKDERMAAAEAEARNAIHTMGTNAFPLLLTWAGSRDSLAKQKLRRLMILTRLRFLTGPRLKISPDHYHDRALTAFEILGPEGAPATPGLANLLAGSDVEMRINAIRCLGRIGPAAIMAVPDLLGCLQDTNNMVRSSAIATLGRIHAKPEAVVPALILVLKEPKGRPGTPVNPESAEMSAVAMRVLGIYGPVAKTAVPILIESLTDTNSTIVGGAAKALKLIDPEAAAKAGIR